MKQETYRNPVWPHEFPDPFVLAHSGEYWAYCTGVQEDGRCFGVLHSRDLVRWEPRAGALAPLPWPAGSATCYWAPEVVFEGGLFYLYYSVGNEEAMQIRVAVAEKPEGPFEDSGRRLTSEPFAIDAHVFAAADGARWLFYATDFLEHSHIGTGTVRDRLVDPFTLAGDARPVSLPRYDWHVYHPQRAEKGGVRWHTVEGPFVLERKGVLYQMFSGGNWQNPTYGVSYATSRSVDTPGEWAQAADGARVLPILRTLRGPERDVVGPGHNSVALGPDGRELFCVYHRWSEDSSARVLCIDRLDWAGERMFILGPTTTPQPAPFPAGSPGWEDLFLDLSPEWRGAGARVEGGRLWLDGGAGIVGIARGPAFAAYELVVNLRLEREDGTIAVLPAGLPGPRLALSGLPLPTGFDPLVDQQLRFRKEEGQIAISWEGRPLGNVPAPAGPTEIGLEGSGASFEMVRLTALLV
jgi:GH43 family beta-xylosidase